MTETGKPCRPWTNFDVDPANFPGGVVPAGRVCRSPVNDPENRPWCYIGKPGAGLSVGWDYCKIDKCGKLGPSKIK